MFRLGIRINSEKLNIMKNSVDPIYEEIGRRIFKAREEKGYTQEQLANKISLKRTSITNIEKGRQQLLVHMLVKIADELEVQIESLIPKPTNKKGDQVESSKYSKKSLKWVRSAMSKVE